MPPDHPPVRSFLSAPVKDRHGSVIGGLIFGHAEPHRFTAEHETLLAGVANQAAIAIANARLYEAAQTEIEERRRAEAALAEARDRAEAANRAKSAFLAKMSHELRTPLNGILGYAQLLGRDETLADEHRAGVDVVERSGHHLLGLINDVLDLAKIEAGKLEVRPAPFRLPDLLRSVTSLARVEADAKGLAFAADLAPALPATVHADERRLRQVLLNLLSNAVKFTPRGSVTLRAYADEQADDAPGDERRVVLRFEVADTGIGIAPEQAERVFQPFEQVADAGGHSEGTGLGLAISRRLVDLMGGTIGLESAPGEGSTFTARLPVRVLDAGGETHATARRLTGVVGRPTVLVVDDKAVNRSLLAGLLVPLGFRVVEAADGQEALERAVAVRPDVVLMDLVMPVVDGFEATRRLRRTPGLEHVPIVALSASVFRVTQQESLTIGCDAFLPKPVDLDALLDTLGTLLDLEWVSADDLPPAEAPVDPPATGDPGAEPTPAEAAALYDLALRGDVQALVATLDASSLGGAPFGARLRRLAGQFQMTAVRDALAPYLDPPPDHA
jgi:signal transduction histidine kinase/ActR/RegA family two-component response regulator